MEALNARIGLAQKAAELKMGDFGIDLLAAKYFITGQEARIRMLEAAKKVEPQIANLSTET